MTDQPDNGSPEKADAQNGVVADAVASNWVDRFCPNWSRPYLRLSRADRPAGTWLLLLPCWWGTTLAAAGADHGFSDKDLWILLACAIGAFLMRGAGCTWNDINDRHIDGKVERTKSRPIPSGQVSVRAALIWMIIQALLAFIILLTLNNFTILLGIAALIPVIIYPFAKRFTWWPQIFLGIAFNWGALLGWSAVTGGLGWAPVLLYLSGICWTLFYDTIYAHQDKEDDALIGVKSTARLFAENTRKWLFMFQILAVLFMTLATAMALLPDASFFAISFAISAPWAFGWHLTMQLRKLDINDPANCLTLFRSNREAGMIPASIFALTALLTG